MYTLVHSFAVLPQQFENARNIFRAEVLPVLQQQAGFIDYILLESTAGPNRLLSVSFWDCMESAQHYEREEYPKFESMLRPFVEETAEVQTYTVNISTFHNVEDLVNLS